MPARHKRSNNNHSSHNWKDENELPFSLALYLSHARILCEHPKFWRVRALSHACTHARNVAPCAYTPSSLRFAIVLREGANACIPLSCHCGGWMDSRASMDCSANTVLVSSQGTGQWMTWLGERCKKPTWHRFRSFQLGYIEEMSHVRMVY